MKNSVLRLIEKISKKVAIGSVESVSQLMCYDKEIDAELKDMILSKRAENTSKLRG